MSRPVAAGLGAAVTALLVHPGPPGPVVWLTAFWYDPRGQSGPGCTPGSAILAGGGMLMAA